MPCYLVQCGTTATTGFHYSSHTPDALPTQTPGNVGVARFECIIPSSAGSPAPARAALYGHGLFDSYTDVEDPPVQALATQYNIAFCATDWWGLTQDDEPFAAQVVSNLNLFGVIVDRLQQAALNTLYLGRLMISPHGFAANPDFQVGGRSAIDTSHLFYDGNSQGGIMGGVTLAVSPDVRRAVLGVTGMDYGNLLLARSTDFTTFSTFLGLYYKDPSLYPVILDLLDQLWDRSDPDGYAPYMTSHPLPGTPSHQVLMQVAYGDFQVSMYAGARRGADSRSLRVSAGGRSGPVARQQPVLRDPGHLALSVQRVGDRDLGQRPGPRAGAAGRGRPADRGSGEHRPALRSAQHAGRTAADLGLPRA